MSTFEALILVAAAMGAGVINAVAGGGTLVTFPALLLFGTSALVANATSTLALVLGTGGSIYGFRRQFAAIRPWLGALLPVSLFGGWLGSVLLTRTSDSLFSRLVPFLILFATLLFIGQDAFRRFAGSGARPDRPALHGSREIWIAVVFQFGVAIYGGYFGAGIGILMLASLGILGLNDIHEMNALKNVLGLMINLIAAIWFIAHGLINWPRAAVMTAGAVAGYYLGAHFSQQIPRARVRQLITAIGLTISAAMFYQQFVRR